MTIAVSRCTRLDDYVESIRRAGAEPRIVEAGNASGLAALEGVDGLVLTGGADVDPAHYGESRHASVCDAEPGRDEFEMAIARAAVERDLPVLAICRGLQVLNVTFGGTLIQDIPSRPAASLNHQVKQPKDAHAHPITLATGSLLERLLKGGRTTTAGHVVVNSRHHQAVERPAEGFQVVATAPDGIVEAIERPASRFCLAVQWHPENFWATGEFMPLFEAFVQATRDRLSPARNHE